MNFCVVGPRTSKVDAFDRLLLLPTGFTAFNPMKSSTVRMAQGDWRKTAEVFFDFGKISVAYRPTSDK